MTANRNPEASSQRLRVLVVDDSVVFRKAISDILSELSYVEVVGTAANGAIALNKCDSLHPDALTLDVEMPVLDGLGVLERLRIEHPEIDAVMVSALTRSGAEVTLRALELGAVDFITKESEDSSQRSGESFRKQVDRTMSMLHRRRRLLAARQGRRMETSTGPAPCPVPQPEPKTTARLKIAHRLEVVAIAVSTGGPRALAQIIPSLPQDFPVPILIVQHMPAMFTQTLALSIDAKAAVTVVEARDGDLPRPGNVYIAPGGKQMRVDGAELGGRVIRITDDPPEKHCKPSADYLLRSVAKAYEARALGVILTGMGDDGVLGLRLLKRHGAPVIAQDEATSVVYGMPGEALKAGVVDAVLPLDRIGPEIAELCWFKRR
jgi:two-component system chemotaxis response regulator CheB